MDIQTLVALLQLADRAPLFAAERLWLNDLKAQVQKQLDAQQEQANDKKEGSARPEDNHREETPSQAVG